MRSRVEVAAALELVGAAGTTARSHGSSASKGAPSGIGGEGRRRDFDRVRARLFSSGWVCAVCRGDPLTLPQAPYTYLLGLYLGDGYIASHPGAYTGCGSAAPTPIPS
jgi:hypothetical protein